MSCGKKEKGREAGWRGVGVGGGAGGGAIFRNLYLSCYSTLCHQRVQSMGEGPGISENQAAAKPAQARNLPKQSMMMQQSLHQKYITKLEARVSRRDRS